jgi:ankyrin repeat protein
MKLRRKFTLGELLLVIMIIGILIALIRPVRTPSSGPLDHAAMDGNVIEARRLIENGLADVNRHGNMDRTALHYAANSGHKNVVALLIEKGADVDAKDYHFRTPLHYAIGDLEVARLLVESGADVNVQDKEGRTPLDYAESEMRRVAASDGNANAEDKDRHAQLEDAERTNYAEVVRFLIAKGARRSPALKERR